MRQGNGTDLLGMNDPRSATIGVIYVSPVDDRRSVLAAILTQEKLNRQHIVVVLPNPNNAFQRQQDFDDLKSVQRKQKLQGEIIFIAPDGPGPGEFARQRRFPVYGSPEEYTQALRDGEDDEDFAESEPEPIPEKRSRFFGGRAKTTGAAAAGAIAGAAAAGRQEPADATDEPQSTMIFPGYRGPNQQPNGPSRVPNTPNRSTLDDDDDLGDDPVAPPARNTNLGGAAALGAGAGLAAESFRRSPSSVPSGNLDDDDDDALENKPTRSQAENVARTPRNSNPLAENPNATQSSGTPGGPGIIDLQPVTPKGSGRNPVGPAKPSEPPISTPIPEELDADDNFAPPPPTHGARRRRTGSMATGATAAGAAGTGAFAAMGAGASNTGPHAISAGPGSTLVGPLNPIQYPPSRNTPPQRPDRTGRRRRGSWLLLVLLLLLMFVIGTCILAYINPAMLPSGIGQQIAHLVPASNSVNPATVTITPKSQVVSDTYVIQAVTTTPNADALQVSLRHLTATPPSQNKTVTGTGHTQTSPTKATGFVTLYNSTLKSVTVSPATFPQLPNGVIIATDATVTIPAATLDANGNLVTAKKAVAAQAQSAGTIGNIAAQSLLDQDCCGAHLTATNLTAFTGGQDSQNYTFVQQSDVDAVVTPLVNTLAQQAKDQFNKQLAANEALAENPTCPAPTVTDDPGAIGDKGHSIPSLAVTVSATCTGIAYDKAGAQKVAQQRLQKNANVNPGKGYVLSGPVSSQITKVTTQSASAISLQVQAQGTWDYQISDAQKTALAKQIAGMKASAAQALLNAQTGFKDAVIKADGGNATLPTDPTQIKIDVLAVSGTNNGTPTPGSSTPTPSGNPGVTPTSTAGRGMLPTETLKG